MNKLYTITTTTPVGDFHMIFIKSKETDIVRASGFGALDELWARLPSALRDYTAEAVPRHKYATSIAAYFAGDINALQAIPCEQQGSDFSQAVWKAMTSITPGKPYSYKELASHAGRPAAIRAAGTACGQNRLALIVPCHRIVRSDGSTGNYLYGAPIKSFLLQHEHTFAYSQ